MTRQKKTAKELQAIVAERLGVAPHFVTVFKDRQRGWHASANVPYPDMAAAAQAVEEVARELRAEYELAD
jgi:hypothetical protein